MPRQQTSRRTFLTQLSTTSFAIGYGDWLLAAEFNEPKQVPLLKPQREMIICPWTSEHQRHDHQLIFPLQDGRLLFVWCEYYCVNDKQRARTSPKDRGGVGDEMPCRISGRISNDKGVTWEDPFVLQENICKLNVKHPNLIRLNSGDIHFSFTGWDSHAQRNVFAKRSADDGKTWSKPEQISKPGWYCTNNDHILRLSTGRILLPSHTVIGGGPYQGRKSKLESFVYISDDDGQSFRRSKGSMTAPGRGAHEPSIIERKNGQLLCYLRNTNESIYESVSDDGGETWSKPRSTGLPAPESPSLLTRIPKTGDLLLAWNRVASKSNWPRTPLSSAISKDDGKSWKHIQNIDGPAKSDAAYPSAYFQDDEVLIAYYSRSTSWQRDSEITLKTFTLDQLYQTG